MVQTFTKRPKFGYEIPMRLQILMVVLFVSMLVGAGYISLMMVGTSNGCLGAPYLYVTHHDSRNVLKFTRDGCALSPNILWYGTATSGVPLASSLRTIAIHPYNGA